MPEETIVIGKVGGCLLKAVTAADGKTRFESDCLNKEARDALAAIFEEEAVLRITPKAFLTEEISAPDTRLNTTES